MKSFLFHFFLLMTFGLRAQQPVYQDVPYTQDYSVKYYRADSTVRLYKAFADRNGTVQILSSAGLLQPANGQFQYPGTLRPLRAYLPLSDRKVVDLAVCQRQFVYLDNQAVLSNAWAGKLFQRHHLPQVRLFSTGDDPATLLLSDGTNLQALRDSVILWTGTLDHDRVRDIQYDASRRCFWILGDQSVSRFSPGNQAFRTVLRQPALTGLALTPTQLVLGTDNGYLVFDPDQNRLVGERHARLPVTHLTALAYIHGNLWFGSDQGAFMLRPDGRFNYYYGERWLPGNRVVQITAGEGHNVLILTDKGLGEICFRNMTLQDKALVYEKQVRQRHIRYGFNCDVSALQHGDLSTFVMGQRDSDNLWTAMYLVSQLYRYKVTNDPEALQNCLESFEAMERLFTITSMPGYFARGFERQGYHTLTTQDGKPTGWTHARAGNWDWRGTTSSDQTVGQMFALTQLAQLMDGDVKKRAIRLMDQLMTSLIRNDWYLIDFDGKPTLWGKWNPAYVNAFPVNVGDRKLYSSNLIAFLQTAYHFTGKSIYREKAYELMEQHGYLTNLLRPIRELGRAPENADDHSKNMSDGWNHSDDEMYFLAYGSLYAYAFTPALKAQYAAAIRDHWEAERPEKDGLWNLCYALTGARSFDLAETIWYLQEFPLDMIEWSVRNSHRQDIERVPDNFRDQTTPVVLPPDERPELKHNRNPFKLDRLDGNGQSELSAGDSFLLPYWMGRYLGVISAQKKP